MGAITDEVMVKVKIISKNRVMFMVKK